MSEEEAKQRDSVVAAARAWIGTPYHMNASIRGVGTDCGQLLISTFADAGIVPSFDTGHSPQDFHLNRREERYLDFVRARLNEFAGPPLPGDVIMFHYGHSYSHGVVVTSGEPLMVVHALMRARQVVEERLTRHSEVMREFPGRKPPLYFTFWPSA